MKIPEIISSVGVPSSYPLEEVNIGRFVTSPTREAEIGASRVRGIGRMIDLYSDQIANLEAFKSKRITSKLQSDIAIQEAQLRLFQEGVNLVGTTAKTAEYVYDKKMEAQRGIDAIKYSMEGDQQLEDLRLGLEQNRDPKNHVNNFTEYANLIVKNVTDKIEDPKVKTAVTEYLLKRVNKLTLDAKGFENKLFIEDGQATISGKLTEILEKIKKSTTPEDWANNVKEGTDLIDWGVKSGLYTIGDGAKITDAFTKEVEKIRKDQNMGAALLNILRNPEYAEIILQRFDLTDNEKAQLLQKAWIASEQFKQEQDRQAKEAIFKEENRFFHLWLNRKLTTNVIDKSDVLTANEKIKWTKLLEDQAEGKEVKTDIKTYSKIRTHILENPDNVEENIDWVLRHLNKISRGDAKRLVDLAGSQMSKTESNPLNVVIKESQKMILNSAHISVPERELYKVELVKKKQAAFERDLLDAINKGKERGVSITEMLNPSSPEYILTPAFLGRYMVTPKEREDIWDKRKEKQKEEARKKEGGKAKGHTKSLGGWLD